MLTRQGGVMVKPIPDGYHTVTPYLALRDAARAIEFYQKVFGAKEELRIPGPGGKIGHAEIVIGDSHIMLADEHPERGHLGPQSRGGSTVSIMLYLENVDEVVERAVAAGAKLLMPVADQFYGDRMGGLEDPFGQVWYVATHTEDVSAEEMKRRAAAQTH
jgi:PhnB protein